MIEHARYARVRIGEEEWEAFEEPFNEVAIDDGFFEDATGDGWETVDRFLDDALDDGLEVADGSVAEVDDAAGDRL